MVHIDEAIKELTKQLDPKYSTPDTPFHNAMKLSIEGLKAIKTWRADWRADPLHQLPGETIEH